MPNPAYPAFLPNTVLPNTAKGYYLSGRVAWTEAAGTQYLCAREGANFGAGAHHVGDNVTSDIASVDINTKRAWYEAGLIAVSPGP